MEYELHLKKKKKKQTENYLILEKRSMVCQI